MGAYDTSATIVNTYCPVAIDSNTDTSALAAAETENTAAGCSANTDANVPEAKRVVPILGVVSGVTI